MGMEAQNPGREEDRIRAILQKFKVLRRGSGIELINESGEKEKCPVCGNTVFIVDAERGQIVCASCGYVLSEHILDTGPEWRAFTPEEREDRARTGSPLERVTSEELVTRIETTSKALDIKKKIEILKYKKWSIRIRVQTSYERNLVQASHELDRLAHQLGVPKHCVDEALAIYRQVLRSGLIKGRSVEAIAAACLHMACRKHNMPRSLDEIAQYTKAPRKEIARCFRLIARELKIKIPLSDPRLYVPKIVEQLKLPGDIAKEAIKILEQAKEKGLTAGKDPAGLAAAAVYIASLLKGEVRTQKEIAQAAQVTEVTVRNRYKELAKELNIKIPIK